MYNPHYVIILRFIVTSIRMTEYKIPCFPSYALHYEAMHKQANSLGSQAMMRANVVTMHCTSFMDD